MAREFQISHAEIRPSGLGAYGTADYFRDALEVAWVAGTETTRYDKTWRLSKPISHGENLWAGSIGYVREGDVSTLDWDEEEKEFVRGEASSGIVVPFVIDGEHKLVTFQLFSNRVRKKTVTGNLQALLNENRTYYWTIKPVSLSIDFDSWRDTVDGISKADFLLKHPNP